ncbi:hypothetical protein MRX96_005264 [Rhipicephalus microplus]
MALGHLDARWPGATKRRCLRSTVASKKHVRPWLPVALEPVGRARHTARWPCKDPAMSRGNTDSEGKQLDNKWLKKKETQGMSREISGAIREGYLRVAFYLATAARSFSRPAGQNDCM